MSRPEKLGKYPITGVLGKGAMGVVYKAFDPVINRPVAIKTIHKALIGQDLSGSSTTARFKNEARAVGRMSHPNIVAIYEYGEDEETAYIAMEYVEGRTLSQILAATPQLPECDILTLMDQLLAALDCAHQHGVWHRDIKPANLIVTNAGQLKVTDFGIARIEAVVLTQITSTIGTPGYMAPEQYIGEHVDHRVDIFAAGALLYGMLVGRPPFQGTAESVMYKVVNEHPPLPSQIPGLTRPGFYDPIVTRALAKNPADRYPSVSAFRQALAKRELEAADDTGETTVIVVKGGAAPVPSSGGSEPPSVAPRSAGTAISGWDPASLQQVEMLLAPFVGPMAKVMVRQAAKTNFDLPSLQSAIAQLLPSDEDRERFNAKLVTATTGGSAISGSRLTAATAHGRTTAGSAASSVGRPLSPEIVAVAQRALASHIGPIASVVAKKAAAKAQGEDQFYLLLAEQVSEGAERNRFLAAVRKKG